MFSCNKFLTLCFIALVAGHCSEAVPPPDVPKGLLKLTTNDGVEHFVQPSIFENYDGGLLDIKYRMQEQMQTTDFVEMPSTLLKAILNFYDHGILQCPPSEQVSVFVCQSIFDRYLPGVPVYLPQQAPTKSTEVVFQFFKSGPEATIYYGSNIDSWFRQIIKESFGDNIDSDCENGICSATLAAKDSSEYARFRIMVTENLPPGYKLNIVSTNEYLPYQMMEYVCQIEQPAVEQTLKNVVYLPPTKSSEILFQFFEDGAAANLYYPTRYNKWIEPLIVAAYGDRYARNGYENWKLLSHGNVNRAVMADFDSYHHVLLRLMMNEKLPFGFKIKIISTADIRAHRMVEYVFRVEEPIEDPNSSLIVHPPPPSLKSSEIVFQFYGHNANGILYYPERYSDWVEAQIGHVFGKKFQQGKPIEKTGIMMISFQDISASFYAKSRVSLMNNPPPGSKVTVSTIQFTPYQMVEYAFRIDELAD